MQQIWTGLETAMSWIKVKTENEMDADLQRLYARLADSNGQVDNVLQIHSLRPHTLEAHMALYKATMHHSHNSLPVWFLECIGVYVSRMNSCEYCDKHHTAGLQRLIADQQRFAELNDALQIASPGEPFDSAQQAVFAYVRKLTIAPAEITQQDVQQLQQAGYSDGEILEINQVAAYYAYVNRVVLGLGVSISGEQLGMSPENDTDMNNWSHT